MESVNFFASVSDGHGSFSGSINNLSRSGLCLRDLPVTLDRNAKRLSVVVSGHGKTFRLLAVPRWTEESGYRKNIGVEIVNAPWGWTEFIMSMEPIMHTSWPDEIRA